MRTQISILSNIPVYQVQCEKENRNLSRKPWHRGSKASTAVINKDHIAVIGVGSQAMKKVSGRGKVSNKSYIKDQVFIFRQLTAKQAD